MISGSLWTQAAACVSEAARSQQHAVFHCETLRHDLEVDRRRFNVFVAEPPLHIRDIPSSGCEVDADRVSKDVCMPEVEW